MTGRSMEDVEVASHGAVAKNAEPQTPGSEVIGEVNQPLKKEVLNAEEDGLVPDDSSVSIPIMLIVLLVVTTIAQAFSSSMVSLFMNLELGLTLSQQLQYYVYIGITSWTEPAIGFISDAFVVFGERRRPLFVVGCLVNVVIYLMYCFIPSATNTVGKFYGIGVTAQFFLTTIYTSLNGLLVEIAVEGTKTSEARRSRIASFMSRVMVWRSTGTLVGSIFQTYILVYLPVRTVLGIGSIFFALSIALVFFHPRKYFLRSGDVQNLFLRALEGVKKIKETFDIRDIRSDGFCFLFALIFVFVYCVMPDSNTVYFTYLYSYPFEAWFFSFFFCLGNLGSIIGALLFGLWMDCKAKKEEKTGIKTSMFFIFAIGSIAWVLGYVTNIMLCTGFVEDTLHIPAKVFIPIDYFVMSMFIRFAFMPTLAVAAEHAPKAFEATAFETFGVASFGGGTVSGIITLGIVEGMGMGFDNWDKLWVVICISIAGKLLTIPLAYFLPERREEAEISLNSPYTEDLHMEKEGEPCAVEGKPSTCPEVGQ